MSLVTTFVRASDGLYYELPIIKGKDYFICFDDDDPPELVWQGRHSCDQAKKLLLSIGLKFNGVTRSHTSGRCFGDKIIESDSFAIDHLQAPPVHLLKEYRSKLTREQVKLKQCTIECEA